MNLQDTTSLGYSDLSSTMQLNNSNWIATTITGISSSSPSDYLNNLVKSQQIYLSNPLPPTAIPLEKEIFPFRTKTVYKDSVIPNKYYFQNIKEGELCEGDYGDIYFEHRGAIPEQLISILVDRLSNDNESKEYIEAIKHLKVAQAYLEKYSLENVKK